jgi:hypothetical protein
LPIADCQLAIGVNAMKIFGTKLKFLYQKKVSWMWF